MHAKRLIVVVVLSAALLWAVSLINQTAQAAPSFRPAAAPPWNTNVRVSDTAWAGPVARSAPAFAATDSTLYAVWHDERNGDPDIYSAQSANAGQTWTYVTRVNRDAPGRDQTDPDMAVNASGTLHAVWEDMRSGWREIYYARSIDGGRSWSSETKINDVTGGSYDPAVAVYTNTVCAAWSDSIGVRVDCSTNGGLDWGTDVTAPTVDGQTPDLVVDSAGEVHLAWTDDRNGHADIYTARWAADKSWSGAVKLNTDAGSAAQQYPTIALNGNRLAVGWQDNRSGTHVYARYSSNTGSTWNASDAQVSDAGNVIGAPAFTAGRGELWATWIVLSGSNYIAYADTGTSAWGTDVQISITTQARQDIAAAGNASYVWAGWTQTNTIWAAARSTGAWGTPYQVNNAGEATQLYPALGAGNAGDLFAVWSDNRSTPGLYAARSTDGGLTWGTNNFVSGSGDAGQPALVVTGTDDLHVAWRQEDYNYWRFYYNRSVDGGSTWLTARAVVSYLQEHRPETGVSPAVESPEVAVLGNNVYLSWAAYGALYLAKSTDGGSTWGAPVNVFTQVLTTSVTARGKVGLTAFSNGRVYLTWDNGGTGGFGICAAYSTDSGATWSVSNRMCVGLSGATRVQNPVAAIVPPGNSAVIAWNDDRGGVDHVRSTVWSSTGVSEVVTVDTGAGPATFPDIAIAADDAPPPYVVHLTWQDSRDGDDDVYWSRSYDGGISWAAFAQVNDDTGTRPQQRPVLAANSDYDWTRVWIAWHDFRRINWDIYAATITGTCDAPLTGVGISGAASTLEGQSVVLSSFITPTTATAPIVYEWLNPPNAVYTSTTATYTWSVFGNQPVTLTAQNCGGSVAKTHTVKVMCANPLTSIYFPVPAQVEAGQLFTLTAVTTPVSPDSPLDIQWSPEPESGQGTLQPQYRLTTVGSVVNSVFVTATGSNCGGTWGGVDTYQHAIIVTDYDDPHWSNPQPAPYVWVTQTLPGSVVPFSIAVQDTGSGLKVDTAQVAFSTDSGATWSSWQPIASSGSNGTRDPQTLSGSHAFGGDSGTTHRNRVKYRISDVAGNYGPDEVQWIDIDTTPPTNLVITWTDRPTGTWSSDLLLDVCGDIPAYDISGTVVNYYVMTQEPDTQLTTIANWGGSGSCITNIGIPDEGQDWYLHIRARDHVSWWSTDTVHVGPFWLDYQVPGPPAIVSTAPITGWTNDNTVTVHWTQYTPDNGGEITGYSFVWENGSGIEPDNVVDYAPHTGSEYYTTSLPMTNNSIQNYFKVKARDAAGNWGWVRSVGPWKIDQTAPQAPIGGSADRASEQWSQDNTIIMTWPRPSDGAGSGVDAYSFVWTTTAGTMPDTIPEITTTATTISTTSGSLSDGQWYFYVRSRDMAGNWSAPAQYGRYYVDRTPPTMPLITSVDPPTGTVANDNTITVVYGGSTDTGGSGVAGYSRSWTQGASDNPDDNFDIGNTSPILSNGTWYFHVKARDNVGNWSATRHVGPFLIEFIPPAAILLDHGSGGPGSDVYVIGLGFEPNVTVTLSFRRKPYPIVPYTPLGDFLTSPDGTFMVLATVPVDAPSVPSEFRAASPAKTALTDFTVTDNMTLTLDTTRLKPGQTLHAQAGNLNPDGSLYFETDLGHELGAFPLDGATSKAVDVQISPWENYSATHVLTATLRVGGTVVMRKTANFDVYQQAYVPPPPAWITTNITHSQHGATVAVSGYNNWDLESECLMTAEEWYGKDAAERTGLEILIENSGGEQYYVCGKPEYDLAISSRKLAALDTPGNFSESVVIPYGYYDASAPENASKPLWPVAPELPYGQYDICVRGQLKATEAVNIVENYVCGQQQLCTRMRTEYNLATIHSAMLACTPFTVDPAPAFTGRVILQDDYLIGPEDSPQIFVKGAAIGTTGGDHPVDIAQTFAAVTDYNIHYTLPEGAYSFTAFACNHIPNSEPVRMTGRGADNIQFVHLQPVSESGPAVLGVDPQIQSYLDSYNKVGPFLSMQGVPGAAPVEAVFRIRFDNTFEVITDVKATLAGQEYHATPTADLNYWTLTWPDLGSLPPGEIKMEFRAYGHYKGDCGEQPSAWGPAFSVPIIMAAAPPWLTEPNWTGDFGPDSEVTYDPNTGKYHMTGVVGIGEQNGDISLDFLGSIRNRIGATADVTEDFDTRTGVWTAQAKVHGEATLLCYSGMPGAPENCINEYTLNFTAAPAGGTVQVAGQPSYPETYTGETERPLAKSFGPYQVYNGVIASYFGVVNVNLSVSFGVNVALDVTPGMEADMAPVITLTPGAQFTGQISLWVDILMGVASAGVTAEPSLGLNFPITIDRTGPHPDTPGACLRLRGSVWLKALWWKKTFGPATIFETGSACGMFPRATEMCLATEETPPPAAMPAPALATDGAGHLMATWIHDASNDPANSEGVLYAAYFDGATWGEPMVVAGDANQLVSDPAIDFAGNGIAVAIYAVNNRNETEPGDWDDVNGQLYYQRLFARVWNGTDWLASYIVASGGGPHGRVSLAGDPANNRAMAMWIHDVSSGNTKKWQVEYSVFDANYATWTNRQVAGPAPADTFIDAEVSLAFNSSGAALATWVRQGGVQARSVITSPFNNNHQRRIVIGTWDPTTEAWTINSQPTGLPTGALMPDVAFDDQGQPVIAYALYQTDRDNITPTGLGNNNHLGYAVGSSTTAVWRPTDAQAITWESRVVPGLRGVERPRVVVLPEEQATVIYRGFDAQNLNGALSAVTIDLSARTDLSVTLPGHLTHGSAWLIDAVAYKNRGSGLTSIVAMGAFPQNGQATAVLPGVSIQNISLSGDDVLAVHVPVLPDLSVARDDLLVAETLPLSGTLVPITATVRNLGLARSHQPVIVQLIAQRVIDDKETVIVTGTVPADLMFNGTFTLSGVWPARSGLYRIIARVSPPLTDDVDGRNNEVHVLIGAPDKPTGLTGSVNSTDRSSTLTWRPEPGAALGRYRVYRTSGAGELGWLADTLSPWFQDRTIQPGVTYRYAVSAVSTAGIESPLSNEVTLALPAQLYLPLIRR